jgi:hypothetical protein
MQGFMAPAVNQQIMEQLSAARLQRLRYLQKEYNKLQDRRSTLTDQEVSKLHNISDGQVLKKSGSDG